MNRRGEERREGGEKEQRRGGAGVGWKERKEGGWDRSSAASEGG